MPVSVSQLLPRCAHVQLCETRQPTAAKCASCGVSFGLYTCLQCNFFDDDLSKKQFHCDKCGICRVGGSQNYFQCVLQPRVIALWLNQTSETSRFLGVRVF